MATLPFWVRSDGPSHRAVLVHQIAYPAVFGPTEQYCAARRGTHGIRTLRRYCLNVERGWSVLLEVMVRNHLEIILLAPLQNRDGVLRVQSRQEGSV